MTDRDENVAGRWTRILLALRGRVLRNSSVTRRETEEIASTIEHMVIRIPIYEHFTCYECCSSPLKNLNELSHVMTRQLGIDRRREE